MDEYEDEDDDEFTSCCDDHEHEHQLHEHEHQDPDQFSVNLFFKGVSIAHTRDSAIGVIIQTPPPSSAPLAQIQKKLGFYVDQSVAHYLALLDGLTEATRAQFRHVYAHTDSHTLYRQIAHEETLENPLLIALRQRVSEHTSKLETFVLNHVPSIDMEPAIRLAQVAIGVVSSSQAKCTGSLEKCSLCCQDKLSIMMMTMKCSHKFCSHCMKIYVDEKLESSQLPIRCPQLKCRYYISTSECRSFLPVTSYETLETALTEANVLNTVNISCPYPDCSVLLDPQQGFSSRTSTSSQSDNSCVECPACQRFLCVDCGVPWHSSMSCQVYQNLPLEERDDTANITLHRIAQHNRWRRCQECPRMIELTQGCYHMTCWCGHEFCYSCGEEYRDGEQRCQCAFGDEEDNRDNFVSHTQESEQWEWDTFNSLPMIMDAYSDQERSQLALIQRFLAGGFSLSDHHHHHNQYQSPPRCTDSYLDAIKDLHQLPWLERFVSVISADFYEDYIQIQ